MADDQTAGGKGAYTDFKFVDKEELHTSVYDFMYNNLTLMKGVVSA